MSVGDMSTSPGLPTPGHAVYDELTIGFALDSLEPGEEALLIAHLPDCERCQDALVIHREVAAALAYALPVEPLPPMSPALVEATRSKPHRLPADPFAAAEDAARASGSRIVRSAEVSVPSQRRSALGRQARRVLVGAGALGIVAAVGLSGYDVHLRSAHARPTAASAALTAITQGGATIAHLSGSEGKASGTAVVANGHAYLLTTGLTRTTSKDSYVIWNLDSGKPTALKSFAAAGGSSTQVVDLGVATSTAPQKYMVSLEKASPTLPAAPSGAYVLKQDARPA